MERVLIVGAGGFLGAAARYALGGALARWKAGWSFPLETLVINVAGCLAIGVLAELGEARAVLPPAARAFLLIGLLGGFTTFSTFGYETFELLRRGEAPAALLSVALQLGLGIGGVWAGHAAARLAWGG